MLEQDVFATPVEVDADEVAAACHAFQLDATGCRNMPNGRPPQALACPRSEMRRAGGGSSPNAHDIPTADAERAAIVIIEIGQSQDMADLMHRDVHACGHDLPILTRRRRCADEIIDYDRATCGADRLRYIGLSVPSRKQTETVSGFAKAAQTIRAAPVLGARLEEHGDVDRSIVVTRIRHAVRSIIVVTPPVHDGVRALEEIPGKLAIPLPDRRWITV